MKPRIAALKLVRETVRELSPGELRQVAGGNTVPTSTSPFCDSHTPSQLLNPCLYSGIVCEVA